MSDQPTITQIKFDPRQPDRITLYVDKKIVARLHVDQLSDLDLRLDQPWTPELAQRVTQAEATHQIRQQALRTINRRLIGSRELTDRLVQKGHDRSSVESVIHRLIEIGLLDDRAYADALVRSILQTRPAGRRLLQQKLYQKKLSADVINDVLNDHLTERDPLADAEAVAIKKWQTPTMQQADRPTRYRRMQSLLARRGFDLNIIRQVIDRLESSPPPPPE